MNICVYIYIERERDITMYIYIYIYIYTYITYYTYLDCVERSAATAGARAYGYYGRTLEAPIPKMSGLVKKVGPFSKRKNPL